MSHNNVKYSVSFSLKITYFPWFLTFPVTLYITLPAIGLVDGRAEAEQNKELIPGKTQ